MESETHTILDIHVFVFRLYHHRTIEQALHILIRQFMILVHIGMSLCTDPAHRLLASGDITEPIGSPEHPWIRFEPSQISPDGGVVGGYPCKVGVLADDISMRVQVEIGQVDWTILIERMIADFQIAGCKVVGGSLVFERFVYRIVFIVGIVAGQVDELTEVAIGGKIWRSRACLRFLFGDAGG